MVEIKEVVRLWLAGKEKKRIAKQLTVDVKTVRRYVAAAEACGLVPGPALSGQGGLHGIRSVICVSLTERGRF